MIGKKILNYEITSLIGEGGMGNVYKAKHTKLDRIVAIKSILPELVNNDEIKKRFLNEATSMSKLQHPNIVAMYDYHSDDEGLYLIMEYVEGKELDDYVRNLGKPLDEELSMVFMKQILSAFSHAHEKGIVHRDIKPGNIIISNSGEIKILDFGIAKIMGEEAHQLTKTGTQVGTVYYMSPEQVLGKKITHLSDIYSLGVTMYQLVTSINPYKGIMTEYEIYDKIVKHDLPDPRDSNSKLSKHISEVLAKATSKDPKERYQTCQEFAMALQSSEKGTSSKSSKLENPSNNEVQLISKPKENKSKVIILSALLGIGLIAFVAFKFSSEQQTEKEKTKLSKATIIKIEELENKSSEDLRIQRNTVYAKYGRIFKSKELKDYFRSQEWYSENSRFQESDLSKYDKDVVDVIQYWERSSKVLWKEKIDLNGDGKIEHCYVLDFENDGQYCLLVNEKSLIFDNNWTEEDLEWMGRNDVPNVEIRLVDVDEKDKQQEIHISQLQMGYEDPGVDNHIITFNGNRLDSKELNSGGYNSGALSFDGRGKVELRVSYCPDHTKIYKYVNEKLQLYANNRGETPPEGCPACISGDAIVSVPKQKGTPIKYLKEGDEILAYDSNKKMFKKAFIKSLIIANHDNLVNYNFSGSVICATNDHPFYSPGKGWVTLNPAKAASQYEGYENIKKLIIGDEIIDRNGDEVKFTSYSYLESSMTTYTIESLSFGDAFIANGLIVGTEKIKRPL